MSASLFRADFAAHLKAGSDLVALATGGVWPVIRPETETGLPCITWNVIGETPSTELDDGDGSLINYDVQVDCWGRTPDQAAALAELVRIRLQTAAATFSSTPQPGSGSDTYEFDTKLYRHSRDFFCWYTTP